MLCQIGILKSLIVEKVNRVNWLRAKARHQRWQEEVQILEHEMMWTQLWFCHQKSKWQQRMTAAKVDSKPGHYAYAAKQVGIWFQFWETARMEFSDVANITM